MTWSLESSPLGMQLTSWEGDDLPIHMDRCAVAPYDGDYAQIRKCAPRCSPLDSLLLRKTETIGLC